MASYVGAHAHVHPALQLTLVYAALQCPAHCWADAPTALIPCAMTANEQVDAVADVLLQPSLSH